jgi:hypothetical protein
MHNEKLLKFHDLSLICLKAQVHFKWRNISFGKWKNAHILSRLFVSSSGCHEQLQEFQISLEFTLTLYKLVQHQFRRRSFSEFIFNFRLTFQ